MSGAGDHRASPTGPRAAGADPTVRELALLVRSDLHRYRGRTDAPTWARSWLANPGFRYTAAMRTVAYLSAKRGPAWAAPRVAA